MTEPKFTPAALNALLEGDIENANIASTPGGIEAQEARGQRKLVKSAMLPVKMNGCRGLLESWGVQFGEVDQDDSIFIPVVLPEGWQKVATEHSMWSRLLDEQARWRASIFYKAAFYDRSAHMVIESRIAFEPVYPDYTKEAPYFCSAKIVADRRGVDPEKGFSSCTILFESAQYNEKDFEHRFQVGEKARQEAIEWADKNFPEWRNPGAYWDEEIKGECYGTSD